MRFILSLLKWGWAPSRRRPHIRLLVLPTASLSRVARNFDIKRLTSILNGQQSTFHFHVVKAAAALDLRRNVLVEVPATASSKQKEVAASYVLDVDALAQAEAIARSEVADYSADDLVVLLTGDPIMAQGGAYELKYDPVEDCFACLGNSLLHEGEDNNVARPYHNVAIISFTLIGTAAYFPEFVEEPSDLKRRAIVARYIIGNIAHFIYARVFGVDITREHLANCVAEINWFGNVRQSYYATTLCGQCQSLARGSGPASRYKQIPIESLFSAGQKVSLCADRIDSFVRNIKVGTIIAGFALVTIALGLIVNLLSGFELRPDRPAFGAIDYVRSHLPSAIAVAAAVIAAALAYGKVFADARRVP